MKPRMLRLALTATAGLAFGGCTKDLNVPCEDDTDCNLAMGGACVDAPMGHRWCAYAAADCPGGLRYSDFDVGDDLAGTCVSPSSSMPTGPRVVAVSPSNGIGGVERAVVIRATFSEPIDPATVTAASFLVTSPRGAVEGQVAYDASSNSAEFRPTS